MEKFSIKCLNLFHDYLSDQFLEMSISDEAKKFLLELGLDWVRQFHGDNSLLRVELREATSLSKEVRASWPSFGVDIVKKGVYCQLHSFSFECFINTDFLLRKVLHWRACEVITKITWNRAREFFFPFKQKFPRTKKK